MSLRFVFVFSYPSFRLLLAFFSRDSFYVFSVPVFFCFSVGGIALYGFTASRVDIECSGNDTISVDATYWTPFVNDLNVDESLIVPNELDMIFGLATARAETHKWKSGDGMLIVERFPCEEDGVCVMGELQAVHNRIVGSTSEEFVTEWHQVGTEVDPEALSWLDYNSTALFEALQANITGSCPALSEDGTQANPNGCGDLLVGVNFERNDKVSDDLAGVDFAANTWYKFLSNTTFADGCFALGNGTHSTDMLDVFVIHGPQVGGARFLPQEPDTIAAAASALVLVLYSLYGCPAHYRGALKRGNRRTVLLLETSKDAPRGQLKSEVVAAGKTLPLSPFGARTNSVTEMDIPSEFRRASVFKKDDAEGTGGTGEVVSATPTPPAAPAAPEGDSAAEEEKKKPEEAEEEKPEAPAPPAIPAPPAGGAGETEEFPPNWFKAAVVEDLLFEPIGADDISPQEVDVLILTVNDRELAAALHPDLFAPRPFESVPRVAQVRYQPNGRLHDIWLGRYGRASVMICRSQAGANGDFGEDTFGAQIVVRALLQRYRPQAVLAVGVAFGMSRDTQKYGDVLVSSTIIPYDIGRVSHDGTFTERAQAVKLNPELVDLFTRRTLTDTWQATHPLGGVATVHVGPILSADKLVDSADMKEGLRKRHPTSVGGEMEGWGVCLETVEFLVIKAITDWADGSKGKSWQPWGAYLVASYVHHVLCPICLDLGGSLMLCTLTTLLSVPSVLCSLPCLALGVPCCGLPMRILAASVERSTLTTICCGSSAALSLLSFWPMRLFRSSGCTKCVEALARFLCLHSRRKALMR